MRYMGGKSRIAKQIITAIQRERESNYIDCFVSLFCGSCSIESKIKANKKILNDKHEYLIAMWKAVQNGYKLPDVITDEQYKYIKSHKDEDKALSGFVGFGCSFGGKWFGGLARNKKGDNYCARANQSIYKYLDGLKNAEFSCLDYKDVIIPNGSVVYADPPYANTTGYSTGAFNTDEFWNYMREISKNNMVFISEENAPDDFECIWQQDFKRMLDVNKANIFMKTEKLWKYK